jgi:hypothetical protein
MDDSAAETVMWAEAFAGFADDDPEDPAPLHGECLPCWLERALPLQPCGHYAGTDGMRLTRLWGREHAVRWSPQRRRMLRKGWGCDCVILAQLRHDAAPDPDRACPDCEHGRCSRRCCDGSLTGIEACGHGDY